MHTVLPPPATPGYHREVDEVKDAASLLRELRQAQGRSLRKAAADIGLAPSQLSRLERGERRPAGEVVERLASYYSVPSELLHLAEGVIPNDVVRILQAHPDELSRLRKLYSTDGIGTENEPLSGGAEPS